MNETSEKRSKLKSLCKSLGGLTVQKDYEIGIRVFAAEDAESPKMNTTIKGTVKLGLVNLVTFFIAVSFVCCVLSSVCRLFRK